jgi:hypothetical protein
MGFTQFMHFSVTTFGKVATGKDVEHDCALPPHDAWPSSHSAALPVPGWQPRAVAEGADWPPCRAFPSGIGGHCLPAKAFNPSNLSTDQWVRTARDMGAGEICLTAHHEGGFCLWPTEYQNYSIKNSGLWCVHSDAQSRSHALQHTNWLLPRPAVGEWILYSGCHDTHRERGEQVDIVQEFVQSCEKYNIKPCFYLGPNANGYQTQVAKASSEDFVKAQCVPLRHNSVM